MKLQNCNTSPHAAAAPGSNETPEGTKDVRALTELCQNTVSQQFLQCILHAKCNSSMQVGRASASTSLLQYRNNGGCSFQALTPIKNILIQNYYQDYLI
jgi:hypothetical protein